MNKITHQPIYADVAPSIPLSPLGRQSYTYKFSGNLPTANILHRIVNIPFGPRVIPAVVLKTHTRASVKPPKTAVLPHFPVFLTRRQIQFAQIISLISHGGLGYTLRLFFPANINNPAPTDQALSTYRPSRRLTKQTAAPLKPGGVHSLLESNRLSRWREFIRLAQITLGQNQSVLILVPEIWLAEELTKYFRRSLPDQTAILHSGLGASAGDNIWHLLSRSERGQVIIGTQKALFLPWRRLGLIIVEEESWPAHKLWDAYPKLDNRWAAAQLAQIHKAPLIYSGSFPSLALYYSIKNKTVSVLRDNPQKITVNIIYPSPSDYQKKLLLPNQFITQLKTWRRRGSVFVLYNRRGFWAHLSCTSCHHVLRCPTCEAVLAVPGTKKTNQLLCRQCGWQGDVPLTCPECGQKKLRRAIAGANQIAAILNQTIPNATVKVLDAGSVRKKDHFFSLLVPGNIYLGTTAAFKHIAARTVDRVAFLLPEMSLNYPDYRSHERAVLLISRLQSITKASRPVTLITRHPRLIQDAISSGMHTWYNKQLAERRRLHYPPYSDMVRLTVTAPTDKQAQKKAVAVRHRLTADNPEIITRGPFAGFHPVRRRRRAAHLILLGDVKKMAEAYRHLPVDAADLFPQDIL
ncbi:MAG: hypothetical protein U1C49_01710 [Candidatus Andersenbacteria bacterium]|nr:hypothetical protein [Candidatus Andersenbacteria bacterium]